MSFEADFAEIVNEEEVLELAREMGFVKRLRSFHPMRFLFTLAIGCMSSVSATLESQAKYQLKPMTRQGLHKRFKSVAVLFVQHWFRVVVNRVVRLAQEKTETGILERFRAVHLADTSSWDLPAELSSVFPGCGGSASTANCKLYLAYEYLSGLFSLIELLPGKEPDQKQGHSLVDRLKAKELVIFDAGFFALGVLRSISEKSAYFICRFVSTTSVWIRSDSEKLERICLPSFLAKCGKEAVDMMVTIGTRKSKQVESRLVAYRVPQEVADLRRAKLRKREAKLKGHPTTSKVTLALCDWNIFLTNAPAEMLPGFMVRSVYRLRWQIELIFKQLKSVLRIHQCTTHREDRFLCELYGRLIGAILVHVLHARSASIAWELRGTEISFDKMWKRVKEKSDSLCRAFIKSSRSAATEIRELLKLSLTSCLKNRNKANQTTLERLLRQQGDQVPAIITWADMMACEAGLV